MQAPRRNPQTFGAMRKTSSWLWSLLAVTLVGAGTLWAYKPTNEPIPAEVLGVWSTDAAQYAGRTLEITQNTLIFKSSRPGLSPYAVARAAVRYSIDRVTTMSSGRERTLYTIEYMSGGRPGVFSFYSSSHPHHAIRFKNQPTMEWTRLGAE